MTNHEYPSPIILTQGDPAGIGPDITLKTWINRKKLNIPPFIYIGDPDVLNARAKTLNLDISIREANCSNAISIFRDHLPIIINSCGIEVIAGNPKIETVCSTIEAIRKAVFLTLSGKTLAIVTNPISKTIFYKANFEFPGHTEFLANLVHQMTGVAYKPVMMLSSPRLKVVPITIHTPYASVPSALSQELIIEICNIVKNELQKRFGINDARLSISGLNPHAGENSALGTEERDIIQPAIIKLQNEGMKASGPLSADTMFHDTARQNYDVAICMYHDQALIPIKTLDFDTAVNVTLGLPFIRTSPDHGTAFNIAGSNLVRETSLVSAIQLAAQLGLKKAS
ncbi:4-hydroxythreonine-4-phosphate dehydrogenase [Liberibacter crescens BT-1]|uniref:4-hydroxythreonine-4-phosphate dehydrogenase n=1 Tax=Liberibacter crescens (strain BT-1) TaxID=1215343 RepID=L0ETE9_LIBCB|nr:4-hydroxythreonine-4-phosphate dehydrogenase PdxA [Liberibacter crescens]AGA64232.1 4-hydroxythreonine-4-phosphate dehydrogenase [Liberibacter crescens BT-1]AMC12476.1 4-hydroxythreonine-4-phosphate dehydrogenase [Liberibacter crescens]